MSKIDEGTHQKFTSYLSACTRGRGD